MVRSSATRYPLLAAFYFMLSAFATLTAFGQTLDDQPVETGTKTTAKPSGSKPTFWVIGDSTVKVGSAGQRGWGDELAPFFDGVRKGATLNCPGEDAFATAVTVLKINEAIAAQKMLTFAPTDFTA